MGGGPRQRDASTGAWTSVATVGAGAGASDADADADTAADATEAVGDSTEEPSDGGETG